MNHKYRDLVGAMHVPTEWSERMLSAAGQEIPEEKTECKRPVWQAAVCAVVLALVLLTAGAFQQAPLHADDSAPENPEPVLLAFSGAEPCANGAVFLSSLTAEETGQLHGTTQSLSFTFADGTEENGTYSLREEKVAAFSAADGTRVLAPVLTGDPSETITGLYAVSETESRWLCWPVEGANTVSLSAPYGLRSSFFHSGIDIPAEQGTVVTAAAAGTVLEAGFDAARGNYLLLDHGEGLTTLYGHCQEVLAVTGDTVAEGQTIAAVGSTGLSTGPHLHFEVRQDGTAQNPVAYFDRTVRDTLQMG